MNDFVDHVWVIWILVYDFSFWKQQVISTEIVTFDDHEEIGCDLFCVDQCDLENENAHEELWAIYV